MHWKKNREPESTQQDRAVLLSLSSRGQGQPPDSGTETAFMPASLWAEGKGQPRPLRNWVAIYLHDTELLSQLYSDWSTSEGTDFTWEMYLVQVLSWTINTERHRPKEFQSCWK